MRISEPRPPATAQRAGASSTAARTQAHDPFLEVIARAASQDERARHPSFVAEPTTSDGQRADVRVRDTSHLPDWATDVLELFSTQPDEDLPALLTLTLGELADEETLKTEGVEGAAPWPMQRLFAPLLTRGVLHLRSLAATSSVRVAEAAQRQMLTSLARRLTSASATVLLHRVTVADIAVDHPGRTGQAVHAVFFGDGAPVLHQWRRLFECYPVLARLLAVVYRQWRATAAELITRLSADRAQLEATFAAAPLGALVDVMSDAGDPHDGGRTVAILTFDSGVKVVYKPKDLRIAAAFMGFVRWLNATGLEPALPVRAVLTRGTHTWDAFVVDRSCDSPDEIRRFYVRMGMYARLVQLLDGTDFTADNIVASGEWPQLIDLETLLSPRIPVQSDLSLSARLARLAGIDSPAPGMLITAKIVGDWGRAVADIGALAPNGARAPFKQPMPRRTDSGPVLVDGYAEFAPFRATPSLGGRPVRSTDHFDAIITGYVAMGEHLRRVAGCLRASDGPLSALRDVEVRCLCRDTHIYGRMIQASLATARLRDGTVREACLERMWKARFPSASVVATEIDAIRDLNVPLFTSRPSSSALCAGGATLAESFFEGTASQRLSERVLALPTTTAARDRELIESVLFTLAPNVPRRIDSPALMNRACRPETDWLSSAERVGDEIVAAALGSVDRPSWVGANYRPWSDSWSFGGVAEDLYSGTSGVGLVLAELAASTRSRRFADAAGGTLRAIARRLGGVPTSFDGSAVTPPGALFGWGAWIYACGRGGRLLDDDSLTEAASTVVRAFAAYDGCDLDERLVNAAVWDAPTGVTGLLLALTAANAPVDEDRDRVTAAITRFVVACASSGEHQPSIYVENRYPRGVMGPDAGVQLALARWHATHGSLETMPDVGPLADPAAFGDALAALSCAAIVPSQRVPALRNADVQLAVVPDDDDALGWLERGELALAAHRIASDARYMNVACDCGERLHHLKDVTDRWMPSRLLADRYNVSAFVGLGAIAHFFLRLAHAGRLSSYRTLD